MVCMANYVKAGAVRNGTSRREGLGLDNVNQGSLGPSSPRHQTNRSFYDALRSYLFLKKE